METELKREIVILDCFEIKCPLVLLYVFIEFCDYFKRNGYTVKKINNISELTDNSIVFMGNFFKGNNQCELLNKYAPNAIYIGWYWQDIDTSSLKYFIYTYENIINIYFEPSRTNDFIKLRTSKNNTPFLLRANEVPELIGTYPRVIRYDYCFMGWEYCRHLIPTNKFKGIYHGVRDHRLFFTYETRKQIYLSSIFALGFQAEDSVGYEHVSQRIFEGLTYGCVVLSNSLPACQQTNGIVIHINSLDDLENKMTFYKNNPELILKKQQEGYEFARSFGTNEYAASKFIDLIKNKFEMTV